MTDWVYVLTHKNDYPSPEFEVDSLAALEEEGFQPYLMLGNRPHPPGVKAAEGDNLLLCVSVGRPKRRIAIAKASVTKGATVAADVPEDVGRLYSCDRPRHWLGVSIDKFQEPQTEEDLGLPAECLQFRGGQSYIWRIEARGMFNETRSTQPGKQPLELPRLTIGSTELKSSIGVDLTAGSPESCFDAGKYPFWAVRVETGNGRIKLVDTVRCSTLTELEELLQNGRPDRVVIDGPCGANGILLNQERNGWVKGEKPGLRSAESYLSRRGVKLFWTTAATLERFDGAREWILRSLALFERLIRLGQEAIETHPQAFFVLLWRQFGNGETLRRKNLPDGQRQRLAILRMFMDFQDSQLVDDDAVDSAAAAVLGILATCGFATPVGEESAGGQIWIPAVEALKSAQR